VERDRGDLGLLFGLLILVLGVVLAGRIVALAGAFRVAVGQVCRDGRLADLDRNRVVGIPWRRVADERLGPFGVGVFRVLRIFLRILPGVVRAGALRVPMRQMRGDRRRADGDRVLGVGIAGRDVAQGDRGLGLLRGFDDVFEAALLFTLDAIQDLEAELVVGLRVGVAVAEDLDVQREGAAGHLVDPAFREERLAAGDR